MMMHQAMKKKGKEEGKTKGRKEGSCFFFFFFFEKEKKDTKNGKLKFKKEKVFGSQVSLVFDSSGNLTVLGFYCCE